MPEIPKLKISEIVNKFVPERVKTKGAEWTEAGKAWWRRLRGMTTEAPREVIEEVAEAPNEKVQLVHEGSEAKPADTPDLTIPAIKRDFEVKEKNLSPKEKVKRAIEKIQEERRKVEKIESFPTTGMLGDSDKIENHQIDFICRGEDDTVCNFKVTTHMLNDIKQQAIPTLQPGELTDGTYDFQDLQGRITPIGNAWIIRIDNTTSIRISKAEAPDISMYGGTSEGKMATIRALMGAVSIEVKGVSSPEEITAKVDAALNKLVITDWFDPPNEEAQRQYKENRIRWQHRFTSDESYREYADQFETANGTALIDHLQTQEVLPGYHTIVDEGAVGRYQQDGKFSLIHTLFSERSLISVLRNGLLSSHERYKRGIFEGGNGRYPLDFKSGGADSVFIGCFTTNANTVLEASSLSLIIDPVVLNRTDWYAYNYAETDTAYGSTDPAVFDRRPSPDEFFATERSNPSLNNELMIRRGIPPEGFINLVVDNEGEKARIIAKLNAQGITKVGEKTLNEFITTRDGFGRE